MIKKNLACLLAASILFSAAPLRAAGSARGTNPGAPVNPAVPLALPPAALETPSTPPSGALPAAPLLPASLPEAAPAPLAGPVPAAQAAEAARPEEIGIPSLDKSEPVQTLRDDDASPAQVENAAAALYDGGEARRPSDPVSAAAFSANPSGLSPASPSPSAPRASEPASPARSGFLSGVPLWAKIVVPAVLVVGLVVGGLWLRGRQRESEWMNSPAARQIVDVEQARERKDEAALVRLQTQAAAERWKLLDLVVRAQASGASSVDLDGRQVPLAEARRLAASAALVRARATLALNAVSSDPQKRFGLELPATWRALVGREEASAKAAGFEGHLALRLAALEHELAFQAQETLGMTQGVDEFDGHAATFSGRMREQVAKARGELEEFLKGEDAAERALLAASRAAMRARVETRLAASDGAFQARVARRDALSTLQHADGNLKVSVKVTAGLEADLAALVQEREEEFRQLQLARDQEREAEAHREVEVTKQRQKRDRDGRPVVDDQGRPVMENYKVVEDHSQPYRDQAEQHRKLAAAAADRARVRAGSAAAKLEQLRVELRRLRNDRTVLAEGLGVAVPSDPSIFVDDWHSVFYDLFAPTRWAILNNQAWLATAERARGVVSGTRESLGRLDREVESRRAAEQIWVDGRVDAELERQAAQARTPER